MRMKWFLWAALAPLFLVTVAAVAPAPAPKIAADELSHSFGTVDENDKVEHTFTLRNQGTAPLVIRNVQAS